MSYIYYTNKTVNKIVLFRVDNFGISDTEVTLLYKIQLLYVKKNIHNYIYIYRPTQNQLYRSPNIIKISTIHVLKLSKFFLSFV